MAKKKATTKTDKSVGHIFVNIKIPILKATGILNQQEILEEACVKQVKGFFTVFGCEFGIGEGDFGIHTNKKKGA